MKSRLHCALPLAASILGTALLVGCASGPTRDDPAVDLANAEVAVRTEPNGDVVEEYRVGSVLRMVKITPVRGAPYYLHDRNGDGIMDSDKDGVSPVYWKIYRW